MINFTNKRILSMESINSERKRRQLPLLEPEQYVRYRTNPDQFRITNYFVESQLDEKFVASNPLPDDWSGGMWVKPATDQYSLSDGLSHVTMVATNPVKFDLPPSGKGTPFEKYHQRIHNAIRSDPKEYRKIRDEMIGDDELKKFMFKHGWVRTFGDEGSLEVEAHSMKNIQSILQWFALHGVEIWGISSLDTWGDKKHLRDLDGEQVERITYYGNVKRRLGEEFTNVRSVYSKDKQFPLPFDALLNKAFRITVPNGDTKGQGYSIVTPFNRSGWAHWSDRPEMIEMARTLFTKNALPEHYWNQIHDAGVRLGLIDRQGNIQENTP